MVLPEIWNSLYFTHLNLQGDFSACNNVGKICAMIFKGDIDIIPYLMQEKLHPYFQM